MDPPAKNASATAERILEHARRAFNERGVSAVGIREIARELDLSPGNVSYYFPTKEDLVGALIRAGHAANNALVTSPKPIASFADVAAAARAMMRRDLENAWLLRDYVGLLFTMPSLRALHEETHRGRLARIDTIIDRLVEAKLLDPERVRAWRELLRLQVLNQVIFWLPSATMAAPEGDPATRIELHLRAAMALFLPHCTPAGKRQLEPLLR